jgi:hypothetical protein
MQSFLAFHYYSGFIMSQTVSQVEAWDEAQLRSSTKGMHSLLTVGDDVIVCILAAYDVIMKVRAMECIGKSQATIPAVRC